MQPGPILQVTLRPSRILAGFLILAHGLAVAAVWLSALPLAVHIALKLAIATSLWVTLRRAGWLNGPRFVANIRIVPASAVAGAAGTDRIEVMRRDGRRVDGAIVTGNLVLPWLTLLGYRKTGVPAWVPAAVVPLLPDSADAESLRAIRVQLRWGRPSGA